MVARWPTQAEVDAYTAQKAAELGIDPLTAVRVRRSESASGFVGDHGSSFGPFQFHFGGIAPGTNAGRGMGEAFYQATGLNARDPSTWRQQVDYALTVATHEGWGQFHGAAAVGIKIWEGITGAVEGGFNPGDIRGAIEGAAGGVVNQLYGGILTFVQNRAAAIILLAIGIFLVIGGAWGILNKSETFRSTVSAAQGVAAVAALA